MVEKEVKIKVSANVEDSDVKKLDDLLDELLAKKKQMQEEGTWGFNVESSQVGGEISKIKKQLEEVDDEPITPKFDNSAAQLGIQNIKDGFQSLKQGASEVGAVLNDALDSAGKQETNKAFLEQALGDPNVAKQKMQDINSIVQNLPGDDSVMQGLLGQAVAKDASLTTEELTKMGGAAADYFAAMKNYGKSSSEAFQDMNNYLMTGNTAEIERSPILANHIDKLKEGTTVQERSALLQEALNEEHWGGISAQDTYNNKLETFNGMLERGQYTLGGMFQEGAKGAMDFALQLDEDTHGLVGMGLAAASFASPLSDMVMGMGQMATGMKAIKDLNMISYLKNLEIMTKLSAAADWLLSGAQTVLNMVMDANPIVLIVLALIALAAALVWAYYNVDWFRAMVDNAWASIQVWGQQIYSFIAGALTGLKNAIMVAWNFIVNHITNAFNNIRNIIFTGINYWNLATAKAQEIANGIRNAFNGIKGQVQSAFNGVSHAITAPFESAYNTLKPIIDNIKGAWDMLMGIGGSAGITTGGSAGISMGSVSGIGSANTSLMNNMTRTGGSTNIVLNGIIEESAGDFIVRKLNDEIYKQNVLRGVE